MLTKEERRIWLARHGGVHPDTKEATTVEIRRFLDESDTAQSNAESLRKKTRRANRAITGESRGEA